MSAPARLLRNARVWSAGAVASPFSSPAPPLSDVAIADGRISSITPRDAGSSASAPEFDPIDLEGRWLLPAFVDSHLHLHTMAQQRGVLRLARSIDPDGFEVALGAHRGGAPDQWVVAQGWQDPLADSLQPTPREFLDRVLPDRPVWAFAVDHHRALLNSLALRECGIEPTDHSGVLLEDAMMEAWASVPELPADLEGAVSDLHRFGITAVTSFDGTQARKIWERTILEEGRPLRVRHSMPREEFLERAAAGTLPTGEIDRDARFLTPWVKGFLDGTLGSRTAWLKSEYDDAPGERGDERISSADRRALACAIAPSRFSLSLHAIGDAAVRGAVETLQILAEERGRRGVSPTGIDRIEHTQLLDPADLDSLCRSRAIVSMQPCHLLEDASVGPERFGDRCRGLFPARTLLDASVPVVFGSDAPIETADPWIDVRAAVDRVDRAGRFPGGWIPEERITWEEAIGGRTSSAARANCLPVGWGKIEIGSPADLQVLECEDPREVSDATEAKLVELYFDGAPQRGGG